jgi:hypothetical protein
MQLKKRFFYAAACLGALLAIGALTSPKLSAAIKATLVETVLPSQPFFAVAKTPVNIPGPFAVGPNAGTLGVTNLILTNFNNQLSQINIFQPIMSPNAADCGGPVASSGGPGSIFMTVRLEPNQTLSLPFPTPLVMTPINGHSCIAVEGPPGFFEAYVTGFVN